MSEAPSNQRPAAIVIGAGIAGLSAAFSLAERGFAVEVYEKEESAGGNLGAAIPGTKEEEDRREKPPNTVEVYPHLFADWYLNFWAMMDKIGRGKQNANLWRPMEDFKLLSRPKHPEARYQPLYKTLRNNGAFDSSLPNLFSGILPLPDMFLAGYASLGALAENFKTDDPMAIATLGDFLNTRFYRSRYVTEFYQMLILNIWSVQPDRTCVYACQRFFQLQFKDPKPTAWVLHSGNAHDDIIQPLVDYMRSHLHVSFHFNCPVVAVSLNETHDRVDRIMILDQNGERPIPEVIPLGSDRGQAACAVLAVPPETLATLVQTPSPRLSRGERSPSSELKVCLGTNRHGIITDIKIASLTSQRSFRPYRHAILDGIPALASTKTLSAEPIPVVYILFHAHAAINTLVPEGCYIGLSGSKYSLTLVELKHEFQLSNSQLFAEDEPVGMVIALAASNYSELPMFKAPPYCMDQDPSDTEADVDESETLEAISKRLLLEEAMNYLPFKHEDIKYSFFRSNLNHRLFLNDVESARYPVQTMYRHGSSSIPIVKNLAFAGDFCSRDVVMSTVEAAIESGLNAGQQLAEAYAKSHPSPCRNRVDKPITLKTHRPYPKALIATSKLFLTPYAVLAKSWSDFNGLLEETLQSENQPHQTMQEMLPKLLAFLPQQSSMVMEAYRDSWDTMNSVAIHTLSSSAARLGSLFNRR